jgi:hypothetical protein
MLNVKPLTSFMIRPSLRNSLHFPVVSSLLVFNIFFSGRYFLTSSAKDFPSRIILEFHTTQKNKHIDLYVNRILKHIKQQKLVGNINLLQPNEWLNKRTGSGGRAVRCTKFNGENRDKFSATKAPRQWPFILLAMFCRREDKAFGSGDSIAVRCETIERSWTEFDRKFECWYHPSQGSISWNVDVNMGTTLWRCVDDDIGSTAWQVCSATLKLGTNQWRGVRCSFL